MAKDAWIWKDCAWNPITIAGGARGKAKGHVWNVIVGASHRSCHSNGHSLSDINIALGSTVNVVKNRITSDGKWQDKRFSGKGKELDSTAVGEGGVEELSSQSHGLNKGVTGHDGRDTCDAVQHSDTGNRDGEEAMENRHVDC